MQRDGGPGGGAGGIGTGSYTGPAEALEIVGDHAYATSGALSSNTTAVTHLKFTSGNYYFVGRITCNGAMGATIPLVGRTSVFQVSLNGVVIALMKTDSVEEDQPATVYNDVIIPAYTEVEVSAVSDTTTADRLTSVLMTGRIYRG